MNFRFRPTLSILESRETPSDLTGGMTDTTPPTTLPTDPTAPQQPVQPYTGPSPSDPVMPY